MVMSLDILPSGWFGGEEPNIFKAKSNLPHFQEQKWQPVLECAAIIELEKTKAVCLSRPQQDLSLDVARSWPEVRKSDQC